MVQSNVENHSIELPTPSSMTQVQDNLAMLANFANKLGVQGLQAKQVSFKTIGTKKLECILSCQRTLIST